MKILHGLDTMPAFEPSARSKRKTSKPASNRWQTLNAFVDIDLRDVPNTAAIVWLILFRDTKPNGLAKASQSDLARRSGMCPRSVRTALKFLINARLVRVVKRGRLGGGASVYAVSACGRILPLACGNPLPNLRQPAAYVPERDQKGALTLSGRAPEKRSIRKAQFTASVATPTSAPQKRKGRVIP